MLKSYHVIVLDFDGVIVESVEIKDRAFEILFQGFPTHLGAIMQYHRSHNATIRYEKFKFIYEDILGQPYTEAGANRLSNDFSRIVFDQICPLSAGAGGRGFSGFFLQDRFLVFGLDQSEGGAAGDFTDEAAQRFFYRCVRLSLAQG